jgi:crotonobetainyl-CoA:carnitine CoA-transferase CaiB-like acyl-CoA transferase
MPLPLSGLLVVSLEQAVAAPMCTCRLADAGARVIKVERPEGDFARYYDKLAVPRGTVATPGEHAAPASPPPFTGEGQGGGMQQNSCVQARPLPNPPPQAGDGAHRVRGEGARGEENRTDESASGESAYFVWLNRGKESVVLDLAHPHDKALLSAMLAKADVFVQNLKPGAIAKLGFALDEVRRAHPRLVICSISGYGEAGPYAARKAYDMLIQAESGLASITGGPRRPRASASRSATSPPA